MIDEPSDFDTHASEYDQWYERHSIEYQLELQALRQMLPASGLGVEIGAGTGRFAAPLGITLGIEPSHAMAELARQRGIKVIDGRAESLPLDDSQYDYAMFVMTVCFLHDPHTAFTEARRILKDDGVIIIGFVDRLSALGVQYDARKHTSRFYTGATFHSVNDMQSILEQAGFNHFEYVQALLPADVSGHDRPAVKPGHGEGSFVVVKAGKGK